eukprot:3516198-Alexandrium_andersonii.AAC.1
MSGHPSAQPGRKLAQRQHSLRTAQRIAVGFGESGCLQSGRRWAKVLEHGGVIVFIRDAPGI